MVEQLNTFETHVKLKIASSNEIYMNNLVTKDLNDKKVTKFNFDDNRQYPKVIKRTNGRSEVESLLKYSIELEKERKPSSIDFTSKVEKRDTILKNTMDSKDFIQEASDCGIKISHEHECDELLSDCGFLDDDHEDNFITINPSGSVLVSSPNPYNKLDKITEANLELTRNLPIKSSTTRVTFNDNIILLETSEDSESDDEDDNYDDSDGDESTTSVDSKLVTTSNDYANEYPEDNLKIGDKSDEPVNCISSFVDGSSIESVDGILDNNSNSNKSVLLVKVPNSSSENEKKSADISSESENEDVCVGHIQQKGSPSIINDFSGIENMKKDYSLMNKQVESPDNELTTKSKDIASLEKNSFVIAEKMSVEGVSQQEFNSHFDEDYLKISETQAGITIKITCPDGTDFSKADDIICKSDEGYEEMTNNHNTTSLPPSNDSKKGSENVRVETKKKLDSSMSDVKLRDSENKTNRPATFSTRVRRRSVVHRKSITENDKNTQQDGRKRDVVKNGNANSMNDSELLAEKIFISLCHNSKSNDSEKNEHESSPNRVLKQRNGSLRKSAVLKLHSKSADQQRKTSNVDVCFCKQADKERPKSSVDRRKSSEWAVDSRPVTAPVVGVGAGVQRRGCGCAVWAQGRLPDYNGLHSEYGLSAEQLQQRKREKIERNKARKQMKEEKRAEEEKKRKENEERFSAWLEKKREQEKMKMIQTQLYYYQPNRLNLKNLCAPTAHL
ncbi:myb-like protein O isoform X2 [Nilaparvata lugens]|nr:myb-like protein O isoform X2 [Nilaparvata lugens]